MKSVEMEVWLSQ